MKKLLVIIFFYLTFHTNIFADTYEIEDVEKLGFKKESQQFFQIVGAIDGWGGKLENESVEVYEYQKLGDPNIDTTKTMFNNILKGENSSNWKELCIKNNILLISKGTNACKKLNELK